MCHSLSQSDWKDCVDDGQISFLQYCIIRTNDGCQNLHYAEADDIMNILKIEFGCRPGNTAVSLTLRRLKYQEKDEYSHFGLEVRMDILHPELIVVEQDLTDGTLAQHCRGLACSFQHCRRRNTRVAHRAAPLPRLL